MFKKLNKKILCFTSQWFPGWHSWRQWYLCYSSLFKFGDALKEMSGCIFSVIFIKTHCWLIREGLVATTSMSSMIFLLVNTGRKLLPLFLLSSLSSFRTVSVDLSLKRKTFLMGWSSVIPSVFWFSLFLWTYKTAHDGRFRTTEFRLLHSSAKRSGEDEAKCGGINDVLKGGEYLFDPLQTLYITIEYLSSLFIP